MVIHKALDQASHESVSLVSLHTQCHGVDAILRIRQGMLCLVDSDMVWRSKRIIPQLLHHLKDSGWISVLESVCNYIVCELFHHANHHVVAVESVNVNNVRFNAVSKLTCCNCRCGRNWWLLWNCQTKAASASKTFDASQHPFRQSV